MLLDDVRVAVRVSGKATDGEIQMWVDAALADMERAGVNPALLSPESLAPLAKAAVVSYVKANYGYDVDERAQFADMYRSTLTALLNSPANVASKGGADG